MLLDLSFEIISMFDYLLFIMILDLVLGYHTMSTECYCFVFLIGYGVGDQRATL